MARSLQGSTGFVPKKQWRKAALRNIVFPSPSPKDIMTLTQLPENEPKAPKEHVTLVGLVKRFCCLKQQTNEDIELSPIVPPSPPYHSRIIRLPPLPNFLAVPPPSSAPPDESDMPTPYTSAQKAAISQFTGVTNCDKSTAVKHLKQHSWNVDQAVNDYFNIRPASVTSTASKSSLNKIFDKYQKKPGEADTIEVNGTMMCFQDLGAGEGVDQFIVSELLQCPTFGEITREGFTKGWGELGIDTIDRQKKIIAARRASISSDTNLKKNVYSYAFKLGLQPTNQRSVPKEYAIEFWKVLLAPPMVNWKTKSRDWLGEWLEFVDKSNTKGVNKDVWEQTIKFAEETLKDESLKWWDETSAWPALIDEFVEWIKEKYGHAVNEDEEMIY